MQPIAGNQLRSSQDRVQPPAKLKCHLLNGQGGGTYRDGAIAWLTSKRAVRILKDRSGILAGGKKRQFSEIDHHERAEIPSLEKAGSLPAARRESIRDAYILIRHYRSSLSSSLRPRRDARDNTGMRRGGGTLSPHVM